MATTAEYGLGPFTFPRGWFMVAASTEVTSVPSSMRYFGQDLVAYRGESGRAYVVDAYCPHMGAHLGKNTTSYVVKDKTHVQGESIRCPYHAWRFGPDGVCDDIPYSKAKPPAAAKLKSWTVQERYGCVYVWHDPENGAPDYDLPHIPEWDNPGYVHWELDHLGILPCHPQEIVDNITDCAHFGPTHGGPPDYFSNVINGVEARQFQGAYHRTLATGFMLETNTFYTGPGILLSYFNGGAAVMYIAHTPVEDGSLKAWHGLLVHSGKDVAGDAEIAMAREQQAGALAAFAQDFEVWANKRPCFQPLAVPGDGPFSKARIWYKQFFNPRAEAASFQARANGTFTVHGMPAEKQAG
jgi:3-ketosteroid 9alpha-monooxygenase subunit A